MRALMWAAVAASFAMVLWVMATDNRRAMERCEQEHSRDTCLYSLR